jgi:hypothetical protein
MLQLVMNLAGGEAELAGRGVQGDVGEDRDGGTNGREREGIREYISSKDGIANLVCRLEGMEREEERRLIGMWV